MQHLRSRIHLWKALFLVCFKPEDQAGILKSAACQLCQTACLVKKIKFLDCVVSRGQEMLLTLSESELSEFAQTWGDQRLGALGAFKDLMERVRQIPESIE